MNKSTVYHLKAINLCISKIASATEVTTGEVTLLIEDGLRRKFKPFMGGELYHVLGERFSKFIFSMNTSLPDHFVANSFIKIGQT